MSEFLEVLESIQASEADTKKLFNSNAEEGVSVSKGFKNFKNNPQHQRQLVEAAKFLADIINGRKRPHLLSEVMTTSDFPILFGEILDRQVLAAYSAWTTTWEGLAKRAVISDFKDAKLYPPTWGADGPLDVVGEASEYPDAAIYEQEPIAWRVHKYGRKVPFSWESMINDDLDMLKDIPQRLGRAAKRTENSLVTALYVGSTGLNSDMYHNNYANIINTTNGASVDNPPLSIKGLEDAFTVLGKMVGEDGEPILRDAVTLVVPPALEIRAKNILNAITVRTTQSQFGGLPDDSSSGYVELEVNNWMRNRLSIIVDPYIPRVATTNGNTSWYLFSNPNTSREAIRIGFLRGHETPEIWMKSPNAVRVGGGSVNPMDGDFDTDAITYRVRHVTGVVQVDPKATVASNGSGS